MVSNDKAKHILTVFWVLSDPSHVEKMGELVAAVEAQREIPGVLSVKHGPRTSEVDWEGPDKAFDYGMVLTFDNFDSARAYVPHPIHQTLVSTILRLGSEVSDIRGFWIDR
nr:Dabb family protein [Sphingobium sp. 15-1]